MSASRKSAPDAATATTVKPALTVTATTPEALDWPQTLAANGNIAAWQEAVIGAEVSNYRITEVRANVGDTVKTVSYTHLDVYKRQVLRCDALFCRGSSPDIHETFVSQEIAH